MAVNVLSNILDDVKVNELTYHRLRAELERTCWEQWVVIAQGQLVAAALTREDALRQAGALSPTLSRMVRKVGEELPKVVRKL